MSVNPGEEPGTAYQPQWATPSGPAQYVPPPEGYAPGQWQGYSPQPQPSTMPAATPKIPAELAIASIVSCSAVTVVCAFSFVMSFGVVDEIRQWGYDVYSSTMLPYDWMTILLLPLQLAAGIITIVWLWQSRALAEIYSPSASYARSRVWVWLGWIVPIVAWWFPYEVVRDIGRATLRREPARLGMWWAGWLVGSVATNGAGRILSESTYQALPVFEGFATLGMILALVGWISIVRSYTAGQREIARDPGVFGWAPPSPPPSFGGAAG